MTGLTNDTNYQVELRAVLGPDTFRVVGGLPATPRLPRPPAPSGFTATGGANAIELRWTDPGDPLISRYQYQVRLLTHHYGGSPWTEWRDIPGENSATSYTVTRIRSQQFPVSGWSYAVNVRAVRGVDSYGAASGGGYVRVK